MGDRKYLLKQKDFRYFKKRVFYWQDALGLTDVEFLPHFKRQDDPGVLARYERYSKGGAIEIFLNDRIFRHPSKLMIDMTAFHEVFESGYFSELRAQAKGTYSDYEVEFHTHQAIRRAENTIFKAMR